MFPMLAERQPDTNSATVMNPSAPIVQNICLLMPQSFGSQTLAPHFFLLDEILQILGAHMPGL